MNSKTEKLISPARVEELFDCYGANPESWPDDERAAALALIQHSPELQDLQREAEKLDLFLLNGADRLAANPSVDSKLVARIIENLPEQNKAGQHDPISYSRRFSGTRFNFNDWLGSNWIGIAAASAAVFVISVSIMNLQQPLSASREQPEIVQADLDEWMWQQVTGEIENEEEPITFMTLL